MSKRLDKGQSGLNRLYNKYKYKAEKRGLTFSLSKEQFKILTSGSCFYCGTLPTSISYDNNRTEEGIEHSKYIYNGIDRIKNDIGYEIDNVVSCCKIHNEWKRAMSYKEFVEMLHRASDYLRNKNNGTEKT